MRVVDLRSDTMTRPTPAMSEAMARADVGDDVFGEDPTINRLEEMAAERLGKEAAVFVASGTMGNLVSLLAHCGRGEEIILGSLSHTFFFEQGGSSAVGGIHPRTIPNQPDGTLLPAEIEAARALCERAGWRPELVWTWYESAKALLRRGRGKREAAAAAARGLSLTRELSMRPLAERLERLAAEPGADRRAGPDGLTRRELEEPG